MTKAINQLVTQGHPLNPECLARLSPYRTEHINRLGTFELNLARDTEPLSFELIKKINSG